MAYIGGKKVGEAVRPAYFRSKTLTLALPGRYFASLDNCDGYTQVYITATDMPSAMRQFVVGDTTVTTLIISNDVTNVTGCLQSFPNLNVFVVTNTEQVVTFANNTFSGTKIGSGNGAIVVPNSLQSAYESAYPSLNFTSWIFEIEFTIPFVGETTLTKEYIDTVATSAGGNINIVTKVIVPNGFTDYESGALNEIFEQFPSMETIDSPWVYGDVNALTYLATPLPITQTTIDNIGNFELIQRVEKILVDASATYQSNSIYNGFLGAISQHENIKKLEMPFSLDTRSTVSTSVPYVEEITINEYASYNAGSYHWTNHFPSLKKLLIPYATSFSMDRGNVGANNLDLLDIMNATSVSFWSFSNVLNCPLRANGKVYLRKVSSLGGDYIITNGTNAALYIGTPDCAINTTSNNAIRGFSAIYVPTGSLAYYESQPKLSDMVGKIYEFDPETEWGS